MGVEAKGNCVLTEPSTATTTSFVQMDQQPKTSSNLGVGGADMASRPYHRGVQRSGVNSESYHVDKKPINTRGDVDPRSKHQEIRQTVEKKERNSR